MLSSLGVLLGFRISGLKVEGFAVSDLRLGKKVLGVSWFGVLGLGASSGLTVKGARGWVKHAKPTIIAKRENKLTENFQLAP